MYLPYQLGTKSMVIHCPQAVLVLDDYTRLKIQRQFELMDDDLKRAMGMLREQTAKDQKRKKDEAEKEEATTFYYQ
jgi:hypothetical protein